VNARPAQPADLECWRRRYEDLRGQAAGRAWPAMAEDSLGLAVLMRKGMAAWMRAWHEPLSCGEVALGEKKEPRVDPGPAWQREAAMLLASMALSHLKQLNS
jgi:hypothetical protein